MKRYSIIILLSLFFGQLYAQKFNRVYFDRQLERANAVISTKDSGVVVAGNAGFMPEFEFVAKTKINGDTSWMNLQEIGKGGGNDIQTLFITKNNLLIAGGVSRNKTSLSSAATLIWLNENGDTIRVKQYGGDSTSERCYNIKELANGNIVFAGYRYKKAPDQFHTVGDCDAYLVATDNNGNELWEKIYGGSNDDFINAMDLTVDGGYILGGTTYSYGVGTYNMYLIKTDSNGNFKWQKTYGGNLSDYGTDVITTKDGGYVLVGTTQVSTDTIAAYVVKTDKNGNMLWNKHYKGPYKEAEFSKVKQLSTGEFLVCGDIQMDRNNIYYYGWLKKLNPNNGNVIWEREYRYYSSDSTQHYLFGMDTTQNKGIIMCGMVLDYHNHAQYGNQVWLLKTDSIGCDSVNCVTTGLAELRPAVQSEQSLLAPNPFSANTTLSYVLPNNTKTAFLRIYDLRGTLVHCYALNPQENALNISANDFENGVYLYGIEANGITTVKKKMVVVK